MKVSFIYMGAENLGVEYLISSVRSGGHEAELLFDPAIFGGHMMWNIPVLSKRFDIKKKIVERIVSGNSDVAAFSCFSANYQWALDIAREIKNLKPEVKTLFGGIHVSMVPERVILESCVDALITGEGEESIKKLLDQWGGKMSAQEIPGLWMKNNEGFIKWHGAHPSSDINKIPYPAKNDFYRKVPQLAQHYTIIASRGCPYNCTYCNSSRYSKQNRLDVDGERMSIVRRRSVSDVITELNEIPEKKSVKMIVFRDDVFNIYNKEWFEGFCDEYQKTIKLPYYCWLYPSLVKKESARMLKESGCEFVSLGMQSVDEEKRKEIMGRSYSNDVVISAVEELKKNNISVSLDHIVGFPGDNNSVLERAVHFYNDLRPNRLQVYSLVYLPGTEIFEKAKREGTISTEDADHIENGYVDFLFSSNSRSFHDKSFSRYMFLLAATTILPRKVVNYLLSKKRMTLVPTSTAMKNILVFMSAIKIRDPMFKYHFGFLFAKKNVP